MDIDHIREMVKLNQYVLSGHCVDRMKERKIEFAQIKGAIENGMIVEKRTKQKPYAEALVRGFVTKKITSDFSLVVPLYIVCGLGDGIVFITVDWNKPRSWGQKRR